MTKQAAEIPINTSPAKNPGCLERATSGFFSAAKGYATVLCRDFQSTNRYFSSLLEPL
jgi:hypothetical protein